MLKNSHARIYWLVALTLVACGGQTDAGTSTGTTANAGSPYCSPTLGPLTEAEAVGVSNAILCPPPGTEGYISAKCSTTFSHGLSVSPEGGSITSDAASPWGCVITVPSGSTVKAP